MIVGDDELDTGEAARPEPREEITPARPALAIGQLDRQDLTPAILINRHRNQHCLADDDPGLAHLLVARVEDQIGVALGEPPLGKALSRSSSDLLIALIEEAEK